MSLSAFLAENALPVEHAKIVVSPRFIGENQEPVEWEIQAITSAEDEALRKECTVSIPVNGKKGKFRRETDIEKYLAKLAVACTVYPNLHNAEIQDSYRVKGAEALLKAMLLPGEYTDFLTAVQEICGFDTSMQDEVDEAKN